MTTPKLPEGVDDLSAESDDDPLGSLLAACMEGRDEHGVIESDDGKSATHSMRTFLTGPDEWQPHVHEALRHVHGRVLDIGCGAGRHAIHLQAQGFAVTGIDISPGAIRVARARGLVDARSASLADVGEFGPNAFSTLLMLWNNFGLFGTPEGAKQMLGVIDGITTRDAVILASSRNPESIVLDGGARRRSGDRPRLRLCHGDRVGAWYDYLLVSEDEMRGILVGTAWTIQQVYATGPEYVAILQKAARS